MERKRPTNDWYRRKIEQSKDFEYVVGPPARFDSTSETHERRHDYFIGISPEKQESDRASPLTMAFGVLVKLERRNKKLSIPDLAAQLDVEESELHQIESDATYRARPRTILTIAQYFSLPPKELIKLAGAAASNDGNFDARALKFAARSDDLDGLTVQERELLQEFVRYLRDRPKGQ